MKAWKSTVLLSDIHDRYSDGEMTVSEVANILADRLLENRFADNLSDLIEDLREVDNVEDYDYILEELYDFGDYDKHIWFE